MTSFSGIPILLDGSVTTAKLADNSVNSLKVIDNSLLSADIYHTTVSGFDSGNLTYWTNNSINFGSLDIVTSLSGSYGTWVSIGPTGSGATVIWTALDSLPVEPNPTLAIIMRSVATTTASVSAGTATQTAQVRKGGSTIPATTHVVNVIATYQSATDYSRYTGDTIVPINSSGVFEMYYANYRTSGGSAYTYNVALQGFIV